MDESRRAAKYLTARDVADELGVGLTKAYEILKQCTHLVTGHTIRVSRAHFEAWKRRHEELPADPPREARPLQGVARRAAAVSFTASTRTLSEGLLKPYKPRPRKTQPT